MCGLFVVFSTNAVTYKSNIQNCQNGLRVLQNRGPDSNGSLIECDILFGHTRLSIQDITSTANQPLKSPSSRYVLVFNGEIYNHLDLRRRYLADTNIDSNSDTLTIVNLLDTYGITKTISLLSGMFALAIYDKMTDQITISRDKYGEKPLFYSQSDDGIYIYSDPRLINVFNPGTQLNEESLSLFLLTNNIPYPLSAFSGFSKLPPGSYAMFDVGALREHRTVCPHVSSYQSNTYEERELHQDDTLISRISRVLEDQIVSDRPVAFFLSGGVDSSLLTAIARKEINIDVDTFSVTFNQSLYDESDYSRKVASILGTNHTALQFREEEISNLLDILITSWGEPFGDSSALASLFLCRSVSRTHQVAISGDGADEVFFGYNRYKFIKSRFAQVFSRSPRLLISLIESSINSDSSSWINCLPVRLPRQKLQKIIDYSNSSSDLASLYSMLYSMSPPIYCNEPGLRRYISSFDHQFTDSMTRVEAIRLLDLLIYLPNDILQKVDICSMAFGLEVRAPFLDPRLIFYANQFNYKKHVSSRSTKMLLRNALAKYIPPRLVNRPKMGFGVPLSNFLLSKSIKDEVLDSLDLISPSVFRFMNGANVANYYRGLFDSLSAQKDSRAIHELWNVVVLIRWLRFYGHLC